MDLNAIGFWFATAASITGAIYAGLAYHRNNPKNPAPDVADFRKQRIIMLLLVLASWVGVASDFIRTRDNLPAWDQTPLIAGWGASGGANGEPLVYTVIVNTSLLKRYADTQRLMLLVRVNVSNVDMMTDQNIEKSIPYTIFGDSVTLALPSQGKLRFAALQPNIVQTIIVMLPNTVGIDQINSLSDVKKNGGRILAAPTQLVVGGPPNIPGQGSTVQQTPAVPAQSSLKS